MELFLKSVPLINSPTKMRHQKKKSTQTSDPMMPLSLKYSVTCTCWLTGSKQQKKKICAREGAACPSRLVCARVHEIVKKKKKKTSKLGHRIKREGVKGG